MSNSNSQHITPDQAAALYAKVADPQTKWAFMDGVAALCDDNPTLSQREVVDMIGDTAQFITMHGHHRDQGDAGKKAKSKLKSIRDELTVVKTWAPKDRVDGVSFEAHKVLNRLGASAGRKILTTLVSEMGGPGNVTKAAVAARLKVADPNHVPQANGKTPAASGNHGVTGAAPTREMTLHEAALFVGDKLTVGELSKDAQLAKAVEVIADIYEAFAQRKQAKATKRTASAAPAKSSASKPQRASVKPPTKRAAPKKPVVKTAS